MDINEVIAEGIESSAEGGRRIWQAQGENAAGQLIRMFASYGFDVCLDDGNRPSWSVVVDGAVVAKIASSPRGKYALAHTYVASKPDIRDQGDVRYLCVSDEYDRDGGTYNSIGEFCEMCADVFGMVPVLRYHLQYKCWVDHNDLPVLAEVRT